jgi:TRAP-type transport system large permease protein
MGIAIIVIMAIGVALILTGKLPTAFALVLLAVAIALAGGASFVGAENSVLTTVVQNGAITLASTMVAILLGSWLGSLMRDTAIASTLVRKTVEFGGDRPVVIALGVLVISALCGAVTGSAPAALLAGVIGIPAMIAVGVPKVTAAGTILMGIGAGVPFELPVWQFFSTALHLPIPQVRSFMILLFPFAAAAAVAYVIVETRRRGTVHAWSLAAPADGTRVVTSRRRRLGDAPWFALLTPLVPIVLALVLQVPIIPSLLAGVLFAVVTTTRPALWGTTMLRSLYDGFKVAAPPITLFIAIGMLLAAVGLPGSVAALRPIVEAVRARVLGARPAVPVPRPAQHLRPRCRDRRRDDRHRLLLADGRPRADDLVQPGVRCRGPDEHPDGVGVAVRGRLTAGSDAPCAAVRVGRRHRRHHPVGGQVPLTAAGRRRAAPAPAGPAPAGPGPGWPRPRLAVRARRPSAQKWGRATRALPHVCALDVPTTCRRP